MKKYILIIIILALLSLWPFFKNGFFKTHDGEWMIIRFSAFHQAFAAGQFPVRFVDRLANNYGYPVINFLYPLPFYSSETFKLLGFGFTNSIKITFILSTIGSCLFMYWALREKFSNDASMAGGIIYLYTPYRFVDLYVRGSIGENLAFLFIPLILGSIYKINNNNKLFMPILSLSTAGLILSHNIMAFIFLPIFFAITFILLGKKKETYIYFILGILMSSFFWMPAIYDLQFVNFTASNISTVSDHLVNVSKLFIPSWGFDSSPNENNGMSVQLGLVTISVMSVVIFKIIKQKDINYFQYFIISIFLTSIFLMTNYSRFVWTSDVFVKIIQFPWRLLSVVVFSTAILTAYLVDLHKKKLILASIIIIGSVITTIQFTNPVSFVNLPDNYYSTNEDSTTVKDEYLPIWVHDKPTKRANEKIEIINGVAVIQNQIVKNAKYSFSAIVEKESEFRVNTFYFPGWQITSNGHRINVDNSDINGIMKFSLPNGTHNVRIDYTKTPIHLFSEILSLISLATCLIILFRFSHKKYSYFKI